MDDGRGGGVETAIRQTVTPRAARRRVPWMRFLGINQEERLRNELFVVLEWNVKTLKLVNRDRFFVKSSPSSRCGRSFIFGMSLLFSADPGCVERRRRRHVLRGLLAVARNYLRDDRSSVAPTNNSAQTLLT